MTKPTDFAYHLTNYLTFYLSAQRNFSANTVKSYRDTFKLLLRYCESQLSLPSHKLTLKLFKREMVTGFILWLEAERKLGPSSLNQRLGAIHAFCKYLQTEAPDYIFEYQRILSLPNKKYSKPLIGYLSPSALEAVLNAPDKTTRQGRRDITLLCVLYDTGARVSELCDLRLRDLFLTGNPYVMLTGKGNKSRYVPLMANTTNLLRQYLQEFHSEKYFSEDVALFFNRQRTKLTRTAISHLVQKYAEIARLTSPLVPEKITPHIFRHTKAMHLCQAGIDMIHIRDILGHVMLSTTEIYARINVEQMRGALENVYPELTNHQLPNWNDNDALMAFLNSL